ncbi:CDP-glycerol glycerophosphotransferase family protein [Marihabitans asiaticum]|uniref:CDP-glycerol glycerophosphotransferase n=1 Tax=Marihabitans asiaticum TaxID=415218 RepID=A0A560WHM3_9MICO|nr:CDP-glycerol glycerophosphotransferase family protein [Marihabitans asiaticum]TWD16955.1 CDP-glycerol glycerophosphotransferase [Marihabitans asiaticum]
MPSLPLLAQRALRARRDRRAAQPPEVGPYSRLRLDMVQEGSKITVGAWTGPGLHLETLWLLVADEWQPAGTWETTEHVVAGDAVLFHHAVVDLHVVDRLDLARAEEPTVDAPTTADPEATPAAETGARTSVWTSVREDRERAPRFATEIVEGEGTLEYRVPLGRFRRTPPPTFAPVHTPMGHDVTPYVNRNGHLSLAIDTDVRQSMRVDVTRLRIVEGHLEVSGTIVSSGAELDQVRLTLVGRTGGYRSSSPATVALDPLGSLRANGSRAYTWRARHDFRQDLEGRLTADTIADLRIEATTVDGAAVTGRVGRTPYLVRLATNDGAASVGGRTLAVTPYYTFKAKYPSLHLELFGTEAYRALHARLQRPALTLPRRPGGKPVWLIGERPSKAQDNGLHLFRHLREHHPEIDAYYVIDHDSPERANLAGLDHVLDRRSPEHIDVIFRADRLASTHHPDFLYPTRSRRFARRMKAPAIFLQHGVMGTKWMALNYGKRVSSFHTDLFLVSSEREAEYIVQDFGYRPDEVAVTGLSRFDTLLDGKTPAVPGQILVLPTWRDWLQDPDTFTETDYFQQWLAFLTSPRLAEMLRDHDAHVVLCLHPNMQQFRDYFDVAGVRVVQQGEVDVQHLLKESAVLVTDYSSPGFDFSFLDKPVIYFQFDVRPFLGRWGSHLDLATELPGPISHDLDAALDELERTLERGATIEPRYRTRAQRFLTHRDLGNNERVVAAITSARRERSIRELVTGSELGALLIRRARRHRWYFPAMRRLLALARLLPARDAVLFESGIGKQYSDSPRAIYEELVRRGDPRTKVWVYERAVPVWDPELVVVKRLSPAYFWHLGRSRYWVTNQNFPHYVRRRRDGVYLQTWHGTPLKRMLHDLDEVVGRDEGYVERVDQAISQWTALLSPSPYATRAFRSAFRYEGEVLELGYPRNDILVAPHSEATRETVRQRLQLAEGTRAVLYAPTFRDDAKGGRGFSFDLPFDLERVVAALPDDVVLLLRMHVLIANRLQIPEHLAGRVVDASRYPDIQELYLVSDVLVTDYSSVFFDYALLRRPMIFHAYDLDSYRDDLRGFYLDYEAAVPGPVTQTDDELVAALSTALARSSSADPTIEEFLATYAPHDDGHAAARVVDAVLGGGEGEVSPREPRGSAAP